MIKVIWSDDIFSDENEVKASIEFAYSQGINLVVKQTWDEAQDELTTVGDTYDAIILDGRGQKSIDAKTNDRAHLTKAIGWLSEKKGMGKVFPVIVFTGFYEDIHELYGDDKSIVSIIKKPNINAVYKRIKECVIDAPNTLIKQRYEDVWNIFENRILGTKSEQNLLSLVQCR